MLKAEFFIISAINNNLGFQTSAFHCTSKMRSLSKLPSISRKLTAFHELANGQFSFENGQKLINHLNL